MNGYVSLQTTDGTTGRTVQGWIDQWNDGVGGMWEIKNQGVGHVDGADVSTFSIRVQEMRDERVNALTSAIANTCDHEAALLKFGVNWD